MSDIKVGDLVMIVKPTLCCGVGKSLGQIFTVCALVDATRSIFPRCGSTHAARLAQDGNDRRWCEIDRLKKIDPPAEGDSLPTRADLEVTA